MNEIEQRDAAERYELWMIKRCEDGLKNMRGDPDLSPLTAIVRDTYKGMLERAKLEVDYLRGEIKRPKSLIERLEEGYSAKPSSPIDTLPNV